MQVKSFLADVDDGSFDSYIRPVRAYSMGSRPQVSDDCSDESNDCFCFSYFHTCGII